MKNCRTSLLYKVLAERILVLDGAMGTMIQTFKPEEKDFKGEKFANHPVLLKGNNDVLNICRPDIIKNIHAQYLEAGADIIETNTFSANIVSQREYGLEDYVYDIAFAGAKIAAATAEEFTEKTQIPRFVAGSIGPTGKTLSMSPDVNDPALRAITFEELAEAYTQQMRTLIHEGVDAIMLETIFDTLNAKAGIYALQEAMELEGKEVALMLSATINDTSGRLLSGQTLEAFLISTAHAPLLSVGLNCSFGAEDMLPSLRQLSRIIKESTLGHRHCFVSCHPNAGLPNSLGQYDVTPEQFAQSVLPMLEENLVDIIGGCCGTTPEHIKALSQLCR